MKQFEILTLLTEAKYHRDKFSIIPILKQEDKLRSELAKLEEHSRAARRLDYASESGIHALGADILWLQWLEKSKKNLNLELAKTLLQKEKLLSKVRKSFGEHQVTQTKSKQNKSAQAKKNQSDKLEKIISLSSLKNQ